MNRQGTGEEKKGGIGFSLILAVILLIWTLCGFLGELSPSRNLLQAWDQTREDLAEKEEVSLWLLSTAKNGSLAISREEDVIFSYRAALPEKAKLTFEDDQEISLYSNGEKLILTGSELPSGYVADRADAAVLWEDGPFSQAVPENLFSLFRIYLNLTDPQKEENEKQLEEIARVLWKSADPRRDSAEWAYSHEGQEKTVGGSSYTFDSESLTRLLETLAKEGEKEENRAAISSFARLFFALSGQALSAEEEANLADFVCGRGERYENLMEEVAKGNLVLTFGIKSGRVIGLSADFSTDSRSASFRLDFGEKPKKSTAVSLNFTLSDSEGEVLSFVLQDRILEDTRRAYIREWGITTSENGEKSQQTVRFSWGKEKDDLGLRFITSEGEVNFRGELIRHKRGKELSFCISRIEENRRNILLGGALTVTVTEKADFEEVEIPNAPLFGSEEERAALKETIASSYGKMDPGGIL